MKTATILSTASERQPKDCGWNGCTKKHYDEADPKSIYPLKANGVVTRKKYVGQWIEPWCILLTAYTNHGIKTGEIVDTSKVLGKSTSNHYVTDNHHVIPVSTMENEGSQRLKDNLKLMGWNINHGLLNGICLPSHGEDYIWHNLQPHLGSHPGSYTDRVAEYLADLDKVCGKYCAKNVQDKLLEATNEKVTKLRDRILNWQILIQKSGLFEIVKLGFKSGAGPRIYKNRLGNKTIPDLTKVNAPTSGRKYFSILIK